MPLKFGTSGVRGLVTEMTDRACHLYTLAFLRYVKRLCPSRALSLAGDHRPSTSRILRAVARAARQEGFETVYCGRIPTPALTLHGIKHRAPSIMVTGSHVPADRNGIKFNMPWGEVLKADEREITQAATLLETGGEMNTMAFADPGASGEKLNPQDCGELGLEDPAAGEEYVRRYLEFFPPGCLKGFRVVVFQHSAVSREFLPRILGDLGAKVEKAGWSDVFIPLDTEAVEDPDRFRRWVREHRADALVSTDGDGDRPLVVDEAGRMVHGDVLGILAASALGADSVSVPVSCNTALDACGRFTDTRRTRIGSPYVIEAMQAALREGFRAVVGYEANGGFLTASELLSPDTGKRLAALPTRDAVLPILALLHLCGKRGKPVSELVRELPERFTHSGLLRGIPTEKGMELVQGIQHKGADAAKELFGDSFGTPAGVNFTDGARIVFRSGEIVHLRPSGNAPEFRCYAEASSQARAEELCAHALRIIEGRLSGGCLLPGATP